MAKNSPVFEADTPQELVARYKAGEIPDSYVISGVGRGGKVVARSKTQLPKDKQTFFENEQRRQKRTKEERSALSKIAVDAAKSRQEAELTTRKLETKRAEDLRKRQEKGSEDRGSLQKADFLPDSPHAGLTWKIGKDGKLELRDPTDPGEDKPVNLLTPGDSKKGGSSEAGAPVGGSEEVKDLWTQLVESKKKIAAANAETGGGGSSWLNPGSWGEKATGLVGGAVGQTLDYLDRPRNAVVGGITGAVQAAKNYGGQAIEQRTITPHLSGEDETNIGEAATSGLQKGITGEKHYAGSQLVKELGLDVPVVTPIAGFGVDVGLDPTTYASLPGLRAAKNQFGLKVKPAAMIDIENQAVKAGFKAGTEKTAAKPAVAKAVREAKSIARKMQASGGVIPNPATELEELANNLWVTGLTQGQDPHIIRAAIRTNLERKVLADAAVSAQQTAIAKAVKDNQPQLWAKFGGKEVNLSKIKAVDKIVQGARNFKGQVLETRVGEGLNKMFNTRYWFPGDTHGLYNKANAMGVADYKRRYQEVQALFKGTSKEDRKRVLSELERGGTLAGEKAKNGVDLGDIQKEYRRISDELFDDQVKYTGKYTEKDRVKNFVYHYYRGGSPGQIKKARKLRKDRLKYGKEYTLEEATNAGLKPLDEADRVLMAQIADHQRQMTNTAFDRSLIDKYGRVTDNHILAKELGLVEVKPPKYMNVAKHHKLYMKPEVKKVFQSVKEMGGKSDEEVKQLLRFYDRGMRYWKMGNTSLRPGHHITNLIGDMFLNYIDGVKNPYKYRQGMQMLSGSRNKVRVKVGNQVLNGDDIAELFSKSGGSQGYITNEFLEGRNPFIKKINEFSEGREMFTRYAHFIDALEKEGKRVNLGASNKAGLHQAAQNAAKQVNKWNINYADLTPFEREKMKRIMPFYTWSRKSLPLMLEAAYTRPGRVNVVNRINNLVAGLTGQEPGDIQDLPVPDWLQQAGYARVAGGAEPTTLSLPFPTNDLNRWFGDPTPKGIFNEILNSSNPILKTAIEMGTGRDLFTGREEDTDLSTFTTDQSAVLKMLTKMWDAGTDPNKNSAIDAINALTGVGLRVDTEQRQLGELRRQQDPLQAQMAEINKKLGDLEVHELKNGYSIYHKRHKYTMKDGFSTFEEALRAAIRLNEDRKASSK